jgi:hypothetical protein
MEIMQTDDENKNIKPEKPSASSFEGRRFSIGIFSTATVLAVIACFAVINLLFSGFNWSFDMTRDRMFSISDQTRRLLDGLDEPVTIYTLFRQGDDRFDIQFQVQEMLNQYSSASRHISVVNRDPYIYLGFVSQFDTAGTGIEPNSIIIESGRRFRVIHAQELIGFRIDQATMEIIPEFDLEPRVTNAIVFVTQEAELIAYELTGHGQTPFSPGMAAYLLDAGYELRQHSTIRGPIPDDCNILIITTPARDITRSEADSIRDYMQRERGGQVLFILGHTAARFPVLMEIVESFGITVANAFRIHDPHADFHGHPWTTDLMPRMVGHDITLRMMDTTGNFIFLPNSVPILEMIVPSNITLQYLLQTSNQAFIKTSGGTSMNFESGDTRGQFHIGVGVINEFVARGRPYVTRAAVLGSSEFLNDQWQISLNRQYVVATMNWLINRPQREINIPSMRLEGPPAVVVTASQSTTMKIFAWFVFPSVIIGTGTGVWLKRRNS